MVVNRYVKAALIAFCSLLLCFATYVMCGCSSQQQETYTSTDQLAGKRIGYTVGSINESAATTIAGDSGTTSGYNSSADLSAALENGKIDAYVTDEEAFTPIHQQYSDQKKLDGYVIYLPYGVLFNKGDSSTSQLKTQMDEFITESSADGTLTKIQDAWLGGEEPEVTLPAETGTNGTIIVGVSSTSSGKPDTYIKNGQLTGWSIDLVSRFASKYGYGVKFLDTDFAGVLAAVSSGQSQMGISGISITDERKQSFDFSEPYYNGGSVVIVKDSSAAEQVGFFEGIAKSFQRTFIDESRWQLFASGVVNTLIISLVSILLGTILGFLAYMICRKSARVGKRFVDACMWLISGMPTVVLLMVLFYIVFAAVNIDALAVSVVAFTLVFASSVIAMMRVGVGAVDSGQTEAAKAMGYTSNQGFMRIIFPQALQHIMPTFQSEAVSLLKATAVVGYISVQDLTRMGDMIRAATFEAFFPLIAVAVIYFILEGLLKFALGKVTLYLKPTKRTEAQILKGCQGGSSADMDHGKGEITVEFCHVGKDFGTVAPLTDVNAKVCSGDVVAVIGGSGCGKSTTLRCLNLLDPPTSGQILLDGQDIMAKGSENPAVNKRIGMVFQRWNLFSHWTVVENVMIPQVQLLGRTRPQAYAYAMELLKSVGLDNKALAYPAELSGGQQQRVAIARTLAMDPSMILMDEPTSALDPEMVSEVEDVIRQLAKQGRTMMIVTHDMTLAETVANRVFFMAEGGVYEEGTSEQVFNNPQRPITQRFIYRQKNLVNDQIAGSFDLEAATTQIDEFCIKNRVPARANMLMLLAIEEMGLNIVNAMVEPGTKLRFNLNYASKTAWSELDVYYEGPEVDPSAVEDPMSWRIVQGLSASIESRVSDLDGYDRLFHITFGS